LISTAPADACGLGDRGALAEGQRADLVIMPELGTRPVATIAGVRLVYRNF
jgi:alpha-D-ribose 1-methylphosphonate 5-triphosphate diphosphatase